MRATITSRRALRWDPAIPSIGEDRPEQVRAASGVVHAFGGLAVILDDASFIAFVEPETGLARSVALPHEVRGRRSFEARLGNKADKLDLESVAAWRDGEVEHLLAFGSGSTPARERWVHVAGTSIADLRVAIVDASAVYASMRARLGLGRDQVNVEGAVWLGDRLRFFQRGNGSDAVDATFEVDTSAVRAWLAGQGRAPEVCGGSVRRFTLGGIGGVRLGFTDACLGPGGEILALAAAEAAPDTFDDGVVTGSAIVLMDAGGAVNVVTLELDGAGVAAKAEGIAWRGASPDGVGAVWVVIDRDDPDASSELWSVALAGRVDG